MIYDYTCDCGSNFTVVKPMSEYANPEVCAHCGQVARRRYSAPSIAVPKNFEAEYYPSLGKVIHNKKELNYHLDKNNLVAVGNDFGSGETMQKHFDRDRDRAREKSWENI